MISIQTFTGWQDGKLSRPFVVGVVFDAPLCCLRMLGVADAKGKVTCAENSGLKRVRTLTQARRTSVYRGRVVSSDNWAVTFYICKKKICEMKTVDFLKYTL